MIAQPGKVTSQFAAFSRGPRQPVRSQPGERSPGQGAVKRK